MKTHKILHGSQELSASAAGTARGFLMLDLQ